MLCASLFASSLTVFFVQFLQYLRFESSCFSTQLITHSPRPFTMAAAGIASAIKVLNIITGIIGFIPFAMENFGGQDSAASVIKFTVGLDVAGGLQNAGGDLPDVRLFNEGGEFLGISTDPGSVGDGSTAEIKVKHNDGNGQQAAYALFSANDNAVCVASISITWPNGDQYGWVGDWGQACGGSWYFNVFIKGSDYKPNCLWIDANGDQPQTGFQVHFPEFVSKDDKQVAPVIDDVNYYCNSGPPFKLYTDRDPRSITYWVLSSKGRKTKRHSADPGRSRRVRRTALHHRRQIITNTNNSTTNTTQPSAVRFSDYLITSSELTHAAATLCGSATSVGPDFANDVEGLFCRMEDKTLWSFCDGGKVTDDCFDAVSQRLVIGGKAARDKRYVKVVSWGAGGKGGAEGAGGQ